jgi:hypothetical protein
MKTKSLAVLSAILGLLAAPLAGLAAFQMGESGFKADSVGNKSFFMAVEFAKDQYTVNEVSVMNAEASDHKLQPETGFRCEVVSVSDEMLYSFRFAVPNVVCTDTFSADDSLLGGCQTTDSGGFSLLMPYFKTAKSINLYDQNDKMVAFADVSSFAQLCGDNICQENESAIMCPSDCRSGVKDGICDRQSDGVCDPDCASGADKDCAASASTNYVYIILIAVILVLAGLVGYLIWRRRNGSEETAEEGRN